MTSFFPDLNVWIALTDVTHVHHPVALRWLNLLSSDSHLVFSRYTQLGFLRLLTNDVVMGSETLTVHQAWNTYDRWRRDPRVAFYMEPAGIDDAFREATSPFASKQAPHVIGDCYLLAFARESDSTLVTFDRALFSLARRKHCPAIIP